VSYLCGGKTCLKKKGWLCLNLGHFDDDCFYYHSWRNNVVIALGTLSSFLTYLQIVSGVVCVVCPFAGDEKLKNIHVDLTLLV